MDVPEKDFLQLTQISDVNSDPRTKIRNLFPIGFWGKKNFFSKLTNLLFVLIFVLISVLSISILSYYVADRRRNMAPGKSKATTGAPRGIEGDYWADIVLGKRDFTEISVRQITGYKVNNPGGIVVDRFVAPGKMYVWDSGNSRILGFNLSSCYSQNSPCQADIVIGQPQLQDFGACNMDSSFQNYPDRAPSSPKTLCGVAERTHTTLEDKSFVSMWVDSSGSLFVPDFHNHRVLRYDSPFSPPFSSENEADEVWGQENFEQNLCNRGNSFPSDQSLCFVSYQEYTKNPQNTDGAGVTLDPEGNLWVADGGNNRVLRFSKQGGHISKVADLVLGQADMSSNASGVGMDQMKGPNAVRFDSSGRLYVSDAYNLRVLVFEPPFVSGMNAARTLGGPYTYHLGIEIDPFEDGIWTFDVPTTSAGMRYGRLRLWNFDGTSRGVTLSLPQSFTPGSGSFGLDGSGNLLVSAYGYGQDVYRFLRQSGGGYILDKQFFSPPTSSNLVSSTAHRFEHPAWVGIAVAGNQLIASDGRLIFWNNRQNLVNGMVPDGCVGGCTSVPPWYMQFEQMKVAEDRLWVSKVNEIRVYQTPLISNSFPVRSLTGVQVLGGGLINFAGSGSNGRSNYIHGIAITPDSKFLWVSQPDQHRVLRIRDPLTNPIVDVILGQTQLNPPGGNKCNRNASVALDTLCFPGALSIDRQGNLYVSDHFLEVQGNFRLLEFSSSLFPNDNTQLLFAVRATKEFPNKYTFEPAFDSSNRMVVGYNPYSGNRFVEFYNDPTNPVTNTADGRLNDFYGWPVASTFDQDDNLYVFDANRGHIMIYLKPFASQYTPTPRPTVPEIGVKLSGRQTENDPWREDSVTINQPLSKNLALDLKADVSGASGETEFRIDCNSDGIFDNVGTIPASETSYTANDICNDVHYPSPGIYTARVEAWRGGGMGEVTLRVEVRPQSAPQISAKLSGRQLKSDSWNNPTVYVRQPLKGALALDLKADVSGASGETEFRIDCNSDGIFDNVGTIPASETSYTANDICNDVHYPSPGIYTARVEAWRGGGMGEVMLTVVVGGEAIPSPTTIESSKESSPSPELSND